MFFLELKDMPSSWYNILPDLPEPLPAVLHPGTGKPVTPDDLAPLFPMELIMQEFSPNRLPGYFIYMRVPVRLAHTSPIQLSHRRTTTRKKE